MITKRRPTIVGAKHIQKAVYGEALAKEKDTLISKGGEGGKTVEETGDEKKAYRDRKAAVSS